MSRTTEFRDNPPNPDYRAGANPYPEFAADLHRRPPEVHEVIAEMRRVLDEYPDRVLIGEIYLPIERLVAYYGRRAARAAPAVQLPAHAAALGRGHVAALIDELRNGAAAGGWPNWVLGNHDKPRIASRVGRRRRGSRRCCC